MSRKYFYANGKRKTAVARVRLFPDGKGDVEINSKPAKQFFTVKTQLGTALEPLLITENVGNFDITIRIVGGGVTSQAEAIRHGVAKALMLFDPLSRPVLKRAGFLTRDARRKERKKPGLKKARRAPQFSKR